MAQLAPPRPPLTVDVMDDDRFRRVHSRIWLWWTTLLTVLITAWFVTLGPIPAIIALVVAKHVLVALLILSQDLNAQQQIQL
jgi:hypothetical protein